VQPDVEGTDTLNYYESYERKSTAGWPEFLNLIDVLNNDIANIEQVLNVTGFYGILLLLQFYQMKILTMELTFTIITCIKQQMEISNYSLGLNGKFLRNTFWRNT